MYLLFMEPKVNISHELWHPWDMNSGHVIKPRTRVLASLKTPKFKWLQQNILELSNFDFTG